MKIYVVDASVAIKWFVDEPRGREASLRILEQIESDPKWFVVPELFFCEMLAVLCRVSKDSATVSRFVSHLESLGIHRIGHGSDLLRRAAEIACDYKVSGYDAIYAATAQLVGGVWLTADEVAHRRLAKIKISTLL